MPDAPSQPWGEDGELTFGTFVGECTALPIDQRFGATARVRAQKRWVWIGAMTPELAVGMAIVRTGYAANVFLWLFDRKHRQFLHDITRVVPRPTVDVAATPPRRGIVAKYHAIVERLTVQRDADLWRVQGSVGDARVDLEVREMAVPATAICPTPQPGHLNVTRKQATATVTGTVRAGTTRLRIKNGFGMIDHSHGMMERETRWQWAIGNGRFASGEPVGFNVVTEFNDSLENVVWIDGRPDVAGFVDFEAPTERRDPWYLRGERLELEMHAEGYREQVLDLGLVASDYVQPLGTWRGTIDGRDASLHGVAELHRSVW